MIHAPAKPIVRKNAVQRCAVEIVEQIASTGRPLLAEMQSILQSNLGTSDPQNIDFEESSLLVRTLVNTKTADLLRDERSKVINWLCGAALEVS